MQRLDNMIVVFRITFLFLFLSDLECDKIMRFIKKTYKPTKTKTKKKKKKIISHKPYL
jgi:hypothetical protein